MLCFEYFTKVLSDTLDIKRWGTHSKIREVFTCIFIIKQNNYEWFLPGLDCDTRCSFWVSSKSLLFSNNISRLMQQTILYQLVKIYLQLRLAPKCGPCLHTWRFNISPCDSVSTSKTVNVAVTLVLEGLKEGGCGATRGGTGLARISLQECPLYSYVRLIHSVLNLT